MQIKQLHILVPMQVINCNIVIQKMKIPSPSRGGPEPPVPPPIFPCVPEGGNV